MNDNYKKNVLKYLSYILDQESKKKNWFDLLIEKIRFFWWKYVIYTLTTGILALFITSLIIDDSITIADMNSWVGIILGLVALVIGIISMILSFYNLDQSIRTQDKTLETIENIKKEIINYVDKTSKETQDLVKQSQEKNTTKESVKVSNKFSSVKLEEGE